MNVEMVEFGLEAGLVNPLQSYHNRIGGAMMALIILTESDRRRFEKFLQRDPETGCLLFMGCRDKKGYGRFGVKGIPHPAHRVAFVLGGGILTPEKPCALHDCPFGDNPACCEFLHLWAGTVVENNVDMARKGRGRKSSTGLPYGVRPFHNKFISQSSSGYLGLYDTPEEAHAVAKAAKDAYQKRYQPGAGY